ncbi:hypothetical protein DAEQUDRAFT_99500 [Daedalea quercina L-15889]|uniref:DUF6533 domain-containing protein n=1 Tax=Daedalea quercina L-15889 TaxID=1314783 RepID=A0A165KWW0_9APHY|nr:hypothetical protein DAEQUDRAFT_99500 [Daedalea quercina L-15889]
MSEVTPQDVETALRTGAVDDYCLAAALTMYLFDRCLCVDQEIACIWRRRHSIPSVVYILLHSVTISNLGLLVIQNFLNMDCSVAWPEYIVAMAVGGLYYLTLAIISSLRVYAISLGYGTPSLRLVVSLVVFALSLGQVAYRIFYSVTLIAFPAPLVGCEIGSVVDYGTSYIIAQVASIAADAIILIVTWCRSFRAMQLARAMSVPAPLYTLLLRDGTIHFGLLAIFNLLSAAFYRSNILLGFFYLATVFVYSLLNHSSRFFCSHFLTALQP